jgi:CheY-like chemotaxis protein
VLRVRDTGIGISPDVLPRVFDLFVQGRQALDRAEGGLGLGLTIVRSLVESHGGSVSASSDGPGTGSEFVVRLPALKAPRAEDPAARIVPPAGRAAGGRARILVVDDNHDSAELMAEALTMMGHDPHVAHDGPEALAIAASQAFDAAFLDIGLPGMNGFELASRLKALPTLQDLCLVAVTGYGQESDHRRTKAAGFHHHLVKPVDLEALEAVIPSTLSPR